MLWKQQRKVVKVADFEWCCRWCRCLRVRQSFKGIYLLPPFGLRVLKKCLSVFFFFFSFFFFEAEGLKVNYCLSCLNLLTLLHRFVNMFCSRRRGRRINECSRVFFITRIEPNRAPIYSLDLASLATASEPNNYYMATKTTQNEFHSTRLNFFSALLMRYNSDLAIWLLSTALAWFIASWINRL